MRVPADQRLKAEPKIESVRKLNQPTPAKEPSEEPVRSPSPPSGPFPGFQIFGEAEYMEGADIIQLQVDLEAQSEDSQKIGKAGRQIVSRLENSMETVESNMRKVQGSVDGLRRDEKRKDDDLVALSTELAEVKRQCPHVSMVFELEQKFEETDDTVAQLRAIVARAQSDAEDLRVDLALCEDKLEDLTRRNNILQQELAETRKIAEESASTAQGCSSEVLSLRKELKQLRADMAKEKLARERSERERETLEAQRPTTSSAVGSSPSSSEIDILLRWISKARDRVNEVETKQAEFELFKSRIQDAPVASSYRVVDERKGTTNTAEVDLLDVESPSVRVKLPLDQKRKRPFSEYYEEEEDDELDLPGEPDPTSDYYSAPTPGASSIGTDQDSSPWGTLPENFSSLRRTKSGAVDKRCLKSVKRSRTFGIKKAADS